PNDRRARRPEVFVGQRRLVHVYLAVLRDRHHQPLLGLQRPGRRARQAHVHAALHDRRGDHENDEEHERHIDQRRDVDVGVERQLTVPAQSTAAAHETGHYSLPSRASVPIISCAKPSSSPANRPSRLTKMLYAITDGTATARPATVVTSA